MFYAINDNSEYMEFSYAKNIQEAEQQLHAYFTNEEIEKEGWNIVDDTKMKKYYVFDKARYIYSEGFETKAEDRKRTTIEKYPILRT
jgi:hypothetical protein